MTHEDRIRAIQAHSLHDALPQAETPTIHEYCFEDSLLGPCVRLSFDPMTEKWRQEGVQYIDLALESGRLSIHEKSWNSDNDLTEQTIALLTRARQKMGGG